MQRLRKTLGPWLRTALAAALLLGAPMGAAVGQDTAPEEASVADGRPILVASQEAMVSLETAREWLRVGFPEFRDALDDAHRSIAHARAAFHDATWPKQLRRTRRTVAQRLFLADRALIRSEMPKFASRRGMIDRFAGLATRQLAQAAVTLETLVPPEPPPLETEEPESPPPPPPPPPPPGPSTFEWTNFTPSADTQLVYVSSSEGSDSNDGLASDRPLKSLRAGYSKLRNGYPDWLLLRRGDTWSVGTGTSPEDPTDGIGTYIYMGPNHYACILQKSGRSATERMLVSTYGSGPRPYLKAAPIPDPEPYGVAVLCTLNDPISHVAFVGLDVKAYTCDPDDPEYIQGGRTGRQGAAIGSNSKDVLIEDCRFAFFGGLVGSYVDGMQFRGSVVCDSYSTQSHSQGLFTTHVTNLLIENCIFIHNGWNARVAGAEATVFNRNLYISASPNAVIRDTIDADGSSGGMQMRLGGVCERNLFIRAPLGVDWGHWQNDVGEVASGVIRQNVLLGSRNIDQAPRGIGIQLGPTAARTQVYDNIVTSNVEGTGNVVAIVLSPTSKYRTDTKVEDIEIHGNIVHDWQAVGDGVGIGFFSSDDPSRLARISIHDNVFHQPAGRDGRVGYSAGPLSGLAGVSFSANQYFSGLAASDWFRIVGDTYDLEGWKGVVSDSGSTNSTPGYPDAARDVAGYMGSIGREASIEAFLRQARNQNRADWDESLTARQVVNFVRAGFGLAAVGQ